MVSIQNKNAAIITIVVVVVVVLVVLWIIGALFSSTKSAQKLRRRGHDESSSSSDSDDDNSRFETKAALVEHANGGYAPKSKRHGAGRCGDDSSSTTTMETVPSCDYSSPSTLSSDDDTRDSEKIRDYDRHHHKSDSDSYSDKKHDKKKHHESKKKHHRRRQKSSESSSSSSNSSTRSDEDCIGQGIGQKCWDCDDCACGLACENKKCVCPRPPAPTVNLQSFGQNLMAMWTAVPGADYYNIILHNANGGIQASQQFFNGVMATFNNLSAGTYYVVAYSGSHACGTRQTFSQTAPVTIGTIVNNPNPQPGNCALPTITGVTLTGTWPGPVQFNFQTTDAPDDGVNRPTYNFSWRALGGNNQQVVNQSNLTTTGSLWPSVPSSNFPTNTACAGQPCCAPFNFGCSAAGCTAPNSTVIMEIFNLTVTNSCGRTSLPTCWRVQSMCLAGPQQLVLFTCS